ncbi:tyrosine-type recombinase/integrase [Herbaspirillum rubrisubalbicans]|uniref:Site-specific integrase n=1 Tax=Herbaspirillum rubrisubalbicans TaxID=80842 RepID=A0AAD0UCP5_9BURK|nr:site-specific integrase [Herbaspirillum rubrisubalbicans]AYR27078.1 site-specific integrase [Herbaspirillum rubrisubalbicans]
MERSHKASMFSDESIFRWLRPNLAHVPLVDIDIDVVGALRDRKSRTGVRPATINRMLSLLRAVLNAAHREWGWIEEPPFIRLLSEPRSRIRFLSRDEAVKLLHELPEHLSDMAAFSLATGLRKTNVTCLEWSQVDMRRKVAWVHHDEMKNRRALAVPLNQDALAILASRLKRHPRFVFTYHGERIQQTSTAAWYKALKRCRIENFRWHDLRHTWASWHVQGGTPLHVLQELGGWRTYNMVLRYAHFSAEHLAPYARNLRALVSSPRLVDPAPSPSRQLDSAGVVNTGIP